MRDDFVFLAVALAILLCFMNVMITFRKMPTLPFVEKNPQAQVQTESIIRFLSSSNELTNNADNRNTPNEEEDLEDNEIGEDVAQNLQIGFFNFKLILSKISRYILNLFLVSFFKYSVAVEFVNFLVINFKNNSYTNKNSFYLKSFSNVCFLLLIWIPHFEKPSISDQD
ncbi:unnamed protein product [Moneuplotes crassus]|uniref:Uncharacterized protein n=1 Tax=Euplotes crassus TaxID=5936 RepID=A0AAD1XFG1_EUPCR|nr:unnamed protein product [Moneuplotes crassus]